MVKNNKSATINKSNMQSKTKKHKRFKGKWFTIILLSILLVIGLLFFIFQKYHHVKKDVLEYVTNARVSINEFNYEDASLNYSRAYKYYPHNEALLEEYLVFALMHNERDIAFNLSQDILKRSQDHMLSNMVLIVDDIVNDNLDSAVGRAVALGGTGDKRISVFNVLIPVLNVMAICRNAPNDDTQNNIQQLIDKVGAISPEIANELTFYCNMTNHSELVLNKLKVINENNPQVYYLDLYARLLYQADQQAAIDYYMHYLDDSFLTKDQATQYLNRDIHYSSSYYLSRILVLLSHMMSPEINSIYMYSDMILISNLALLLDKGNEDALLDLASFYSSVGDYESAIKVYQYIPVTSYYYRMIVAPVLTIYKDLGHYGDALDFLDSQITADSENAKLLLEKGHIYYKLKQYDAAIEEYNTALELAQIQNNKLALWLSYFFRGVAYDKSDNWKLAEKDLLAAKSINASDPLLINYLAYSWIVRDKNIDQSMQMLAEALKFDNNNPNLLDSYGWGYFTQQQYQKALIYIERASKLSPNDYQILDHLGDVMWQLGYKFDANMLWSKAINLSHDNDVALIEEKIGGKLPKYLDPNVKEQQKKYFNN